MSTQSQQTAPPIPPSDYYVALRRVVYMASLGAALIFIYGAGLAREGGGNFANSLSVGLMAAGAAMVSGGLLGFLFGVPHTREGEPNQIERDGRGKSVEQADKPGPSDPSTSYRPNTSLEQISDWLTKMLVGVGLIEIKVIPGKLKGVAAYIANGLGDNDQARAFALTLLIFFSVCGFVFGFLWARLYLKRWFTEADQVRMLGEKIDRLEEKRLVDARAIALIAHEINRGQDDPPADPKQIEEAIKAASSPIRAQIFSQAEEASDNRDADDYDVKVQTAISIFRGLIASDTRARYHRNHSELSYALERQSPPDLEGAINEMTRAIETRNKLGVKGWRYYEFRRARQRIRHDESFKRGVGSQPAVVDEILNDLRAAFRDGEKWQKWYDGEADVRKWAELNKVNEGVLRGS
jgi:hypothetical protein